MQRVLWSSQCFYKRELFHNWRGVWKSPKQLIISCQIFLVEGSWKQFVRRILQSIRCYIGSFSMPLPFNFSMVVEIKNKKKNLTPFIFREAYVIVVDIETFHDWKINGNGFQSKYILYRTLFILIFFLSFELYMIHM